MSDDGEGRPAHRVAGGAAVARQFDRMREKVAIITGAGQGIGRAAALLFAREGARVVAADWNAESGGRTAAMIEDEGGEAIFVQCDVTREADVKAMVAQSVDAFGGVDGLVNNAGIYPVLGGIVETAEADWDATVGVSLKGTYLCTRHAVPAMAKRGAGTVVNVASTYAIAADQGWGAYTAAKAGVVGITKSCTVDYSHLNIRFNCVCPGGIATEGVGEANPYASKGQYANFYKDGAYSTFDTERRYSDAEVDFIQRNMVKAKPLGRRASPFELASVMLFLSCEESSWVTGAVIPVDGGETSLLAGTVVRNLTETGAL